jgi:hypothetical protein
MPHKDGSRSQHLPDEKFKYIDTEFRHDRYENTEKLIDVCYHASQELAKNAIKNVSTAPTSGHRRETPKGVTYSVFRNVAVHQILYDHSKGTNVRCSYDCPPEFRGNGMHDASIFGKGMVCALLALDMDKAELCVMFFEVHLRETTVSLTFTFPFNYTNVK